MLSRTSSLYVSLFFTVVLCVIHPVSAQNRGYRDPDYTSDQRVEPDPRYRDTDSQYRPYRNPSQEDDYARAEDDYNRRPASQDDSRPYRPDPYSRPRDGERRDPDTARNRLREELTRIRPSAQTPAKTQTNEAFAPPLPSRRKETVSSAPLQTTTAVNVAAPAQPTPELEKLTSDIIILRFTGTSSNDEGVKSVRGLLQNGMVAGVLINSDNIVNKQQARELMKSLTPVGSKLKPLIAAHDAGGANSLLASERGFPSVPSQKDVAAKGDPNYSYLAYQTLSSNLAALGFNLNFAPWLGTAKSASESFGTDALQVSVFAKTFILAHKESGIIPVPIVDMDDPRTLTLKALLVSFSDIAMADIPVAGANIKPFPPGQENRGPRFCFIARSEDVQNLGREMKRGCDAFVVTFKQGTPASVRQSIVQGFAEAIAKGDLSLDSLAAASQRINALRASLGPVKEPQSRGASRTN